MLKIILHETRHIWPFNEPARDLRIQNKPLWVWQRDVLAPYTRREITLLPGQGLPPVQGEVLIYRDNLFFDTPFMEAFLKEARRRDYPSRVAFTLDNPAFREHMLPLSRSYVKQGNVYLADLWYYPRGITQEPAEPLIVDMQVREIGYHHVPPYMARELGDLTFYVPLRGFMAIDTWVHILLADVVMGLFARGARFEDRLKRDPLFKLRILFKAMLEGKQVLESSELVRIGKNCVIDPTAVIHGPTTIGDHVTIGAGVVIDNCIIGNNVNISQGCQLLLSVVGDGSFLPFRASLFMTTFMENSTVAQNTCLQLCVVGRNSFIGAGTTFTDFNLLNKPLKARNAYGQLEPIPLPVLGGCVGHNCRIGSGFVVYPARAIESDVVLIAREDRHVITKDVRYEDSDHHRLRDHRHVRMYPREDEEEETPSAIGQIHKVGGTP